MTRMLGIEVRLCAYRDKFGLLEVGSEITFENTPEAFFEAKSFCRWLGESVP